MKPIYVVLIAIASALAGGVIGSLLGGLTGSIAGGFGGGALGMKAGVCTAAEVTKTQKLLTPAQVDQLVKQSYAQLTGLSGNKNLVLTNNPDCQTTLRQVKELAK